jgi:dimethylhistidine N-methyltransferase
MTNLADAPDPVAAVEFIQTYRKNTDAIRNELSTGLLAPAAYTSPKYLYDALGSKLFAAICELPEYYPTRTEAAIFNTHLTAIAQSVGTGSTLIDLGAGNCAKATRLFPALQPSQYVPVDISVDFLRDAVTLLRQRYPRINMVAVGMDFSEEFTLPACVQNKRRLLFYPGSSIGNFMPQEAVAFLSRLHASCSVNGATDGGLLIGVDLIKDHKILDAAYDDALGVTASFNLNLLLHLNDLLEADFDVRDWQHRGFFNSALQRIEMHLEARHAVSVCWNGGQRHFAAGERIHTENSYKYTERGFIQLLEQAGFHDIRTWIDAQEWFLICHARAG